MYDRSFATIKFIVAQLRMCGSFSFNTEINGSISTIVLNDLVRLLKYS